MEINKDNYKDWLIRYLENDLSITEKADVELYIKENNDAATEWELLKRTRLQPDMSIRFPNKSLLFRTEEPVVELKKPVVIYSLYRYAAFAAAAAVLAFVIIFTIRKPENKTQTAQSTNQIENNPAATTPDNAQAVNPSTRGANLAKVENNINENSRKNGVTPSSKKNLFAKQLPAKVKQAKPDQLQQSAPAPEHSQSNPVADQKKPVTQQKEPENAPVHQAPAQELAVVNQPVSKTTSHVPAKTVSNHPNVDSDDETVLGSLLSLFHHVSVKKEEKNQQTYYALSIQTSNISINKSFK